MFGVHMNHQLTTTVRNASTSATLTVLGFGLAILSAVMLFIMWAAFGNVWPLVFIAFVPVLVAMHRVLPRRWSPVALGIASFGYWLALGLQAGGVIPLAVIVAVSVLIGAIWCVLGIWERSFAQRTQYKWFIAQFAVLWVGIEIIFGGNLILGSNFWIAYRTASVPALIQPVSFLSSPALSFLIIMINSVIALLVIRWIDSKWPQLSTHHVPTKTVKVSTILVLGITAAWVVTSLFTYTKVNNDLGPTVRVAAVQSGIQYTTSSGELGGGGPQGTPEDNVRNAKLQKQLTELTLQAAAEGAELVVWPEEELNYDVREGSKGQWVGELAKTANVTIVSGFMPLSPDLTSPNMAAVWFPNGQLQSQFYSKMHPVVVEGEAFETGEINPIYLAPFGNLGVVICFDHDHPDSSIRTTVAAGANIVAVPAIDPASISHLRWQSLVFRAVENRVPMVKTDVGFDSAIINANGVVVDKISVDDDAGQTAVLVGDVNLGPRDALFTTTGGYPFATVLILGLIARYTRHIYLWRQDKINN